MKSLKTALLIIALAAFLKVSAQTFEQTFTGHWARTYWTHIFHKDGTYVGSSAGHFGDLLFIGTYTVEADTIHVTAVSGGTDHEMDEHYLLDKDSMLINLETLYDYAPRKLKWEYASKKRYDIQKTPNPIVSRTFEQTFSGQWAMTLWKFEFHKDGTYQRTSSGHFGNPVFAGTYSVQSDTIHLLSGYEASSGTVNEYYLIDKDSMLVDLKNLYDYAPGDAFHLSRKRYELLKKPDMDQQIVVTKAQLDSMVVQSQQLLASKQLNELTDDEHIQIIRLFNTIWMDRDELPATDSYDAFMQALEASHYEEEMPSLYDWTLSRGMGYYFYKLQVEWGGTPHFYSRFTIR